MQKFATKLAVILLVFMASILLCHHASAAKLDQPNILLAENDVVENPPPPDIANLLDKGRLEFAKKTIALYGDKIPKSAQENILLQKITIGMSPYEAKLAGGAFFFKVTADRKVWPPDAHPDPYVVMDKQSVAPDDSEIWLTFKNATQYPGEGMIRFTAYITKGKVQSIEKHVTNP